MAGFALARRLLLLLVTLTGIAVGQTTICTGECARTCSSVSQFDVQVTGCLSCGDRGIVWGTDTYTTDSSVPMAVVHAGLTTPGVTVTVRIICGPSQSTYGSTRNGVTTLTYTPAFPTFTMVLSSQAPALLCTGECARPCQNGIQFQVQVTGCLACGDRGIVWGTDIYTTDSSVPMAVVHAGLAQPGQTTVINIICMDQESTVGSTRNGVTTRSYSPLWPVFRMTSATTYCCGSVADQCASLHAICSALHAVDVASICSEDASFCSIASTAQSIYNLCLQAAAHCDALYSGC